MALVLRDLVEAEGIEPSSESRSDRSPTRVVRHLDFAIPDTAGLGHGAASSMKSRPPDSSES